jgi:hypothetical protein
MHVVAEVVKKRHFVDLAVLQDQGDVLYGQYRKVARQAESHLGEHGVDIGVPENKPAAQRLPDVDGQNQQGRTVADKSDQDSVIDDVFQLIFAEDILE